MAHVHWCKDDHYSAGDMCADRGYCECECGATVKVTSWVEPERTIISRTPFCIVYSDGTVTPDECTVRPFYLPFCAHDMLRQNKYIGAIKAIREEYHAGLRESKDIVDLALGKAIPQRSA